MNLPFIFTTLKKKSQLSCETAILSKIHEKLVISIQYMKPLRFFCFCNITGMNLLTFKVFLPVFPRRCEDFFLKNKRRTQFREMSPRTPVATINESWKALQQTGLLHPLFSEFQQINAVRSLQVVLMFVLI